MGRGIGLNLTSDRTIAYPQAVVFRLALILLFLSPSALWGQTTRPSRAEVAGSFMAFDQAYISAWEAGLISPEDRARISKEFDELTTIFVRKNNPQEAARRLDLLTRALPASVDLPMPAIDTSRRVGFEARGKALLDRVKKIEGLSTPARNATVARIGLLKDQPSPTTSAEFLTARDELLFALEAEIAALEKQPTKPLVPVGTYWTIFTASNGTTVPAYVHVPRRGEDKPLPAVIAFHGVAVDESMFVFGYGGGLLTRLAYDRGFVVISPNTFATLGAGNVLPAMLDQLPLNIDRDRVYIIGHSLGAICAWGVTNENPDKVRALALIGAVIGPSSAATKLPPTKLILGELDHLFSHARALERVKQLKDQGARFEYELIQNTGHTTIVGEELRGLVDWLMKQ